MANNVVEARSCRWLLPPRSRDEDIDVRGRMHCAGPLDFELGRGPLLDRIADQEGAKDRSQAEARRRSARRIAGLTARFRDIEVYRGKVTVPCASIERLLQRSNIF